MQSIKSYTDIAQSKKLAKILSIESADMYWDLLSKDKYAKVNNIGYCLRRTCVYAWSFAALINVIPQEIFDGEYIINITEGKDYKWIITYDHCESRQSFYSLSSGADNLVDACVAIIEKLNKLKML